MKVHIQNIVCFDLKQVYWQRKWA